MKQPSQDKSAVHLRGLTRRAALAAPLLGVSLFAESARAQTDNPSEGLLTAARRPSCVDIDGQPMHYLDYGRGFPILLGHSYLWDSQMWAPQIRALARRYRVIVPDLWGHGRSGDLPASTRSLGDLAIQAGQLLDALRIRECAVVGLSVGGMWGAELALREPSRVRALVMMDTYLGAEPAASQARYFQILDTVESLGYFPPAILDGVVPLFFRQGADMSAPLPTAFRRSLEGISPRTLRKSVVPMGRLIFGRTDQRSRLGGLDPDRTLLMCGALDMARPPSETAEMAGLIGCSHIFIPEAGHISNLENAAFVTSALSTWLARHATHRYGLYE